MQNVLAFDPRTIGRHMPRQRYQRGQLETFVPARNGRKERKLPRGTYWARWYRYVRQPDGSEKRCAREKIIAKELAAKYHIGTGYSGPLKKNDAEDVLKLLIAQDTGTYVPPDTEATFDQIAREYIAIKEPNWGRQEKSTSKNIIEKHLIGMLGQRPVASLETLELQNFLNGRVATGASKSQLNKLLRHLRGILDQAVVKKCISANPARTPIYKLKAKSQKRQNRSTLSLEQCQRLLSVLVGEHHLIVRMFIQLGPRPEEEFALRRDDVIGEALRIDEAVVGGRVSGLKTEASEDLMFIPPDLGVELRTWMECIADEPDAWLFPARRGGSWDHHNYLNRILKPAGVRAKILLRDTGKKTKSGEPLLTSGLNFQILRRTSATLFGKRAKDARITQAHLRHADPHVTLKYYQQAIPESVKTAALAFEADLFPSRTVGEIQ